MTPSTPPNGLEREGLTARNSVIFDRLVPTAEVVGYGPYKRFLLTEAQIEMLMSAAAEPLRTPSPDIEAIQREAYKRGWSDREDDILERAERILPDHLAGGGDMYTRQSFDDLRTAIGRLDPEFPNYGDWPISLPAGHWRAILAALSQQEPDRQGAWRPIGVRPEPGRKIIALFDDGSGARLFYVHDGGLIDADEGDEWDADALDENYGLWAYLPSDFSLWCENRSDDPLKFPVPTTTGGGEDGREAAD